MPDFDKQRIQYDRGIDWEKMDNTRMALRVTKPMAKPIRPTPDGSVEIVWYRNDRIRYYFADMRDWRNEPDKVMIRTLTGRLEFNKRYIKEIAIEYNSPEYQELLKECLFLEHEWIHTQPSNVYLDEGHGAGSSCQHPDCEAAKAKARHEQNVQGIIDNRD